MDDDMIVLDSDTATYTFTGVPNRPVPSLFRGFSAPVKIKSEAPEADKLFLARHDSDPFGRWQALQDVSMSLLVDAVSGKPWSEAQLSGLAAAIEDTATSKTLDDAFKALAITLPGVGEIALTKGQDVDPAAILEARNRMIQQIVDKVGGALETVYHDKALAADYAPTPQQTGQRALRNAALGYLVRGLGDKGAALAAEQYRAARNMTDRFAALSGAVMVWTPQAAGLLGDFRTMHTADPLVFDKWLMLNAGPAHDETIDRLRAILADPDFPRNNPNRLRALVFSFAGGNLVQFARPDGEGFRFVTEFVADVDQRNPQVAARVLTAFRIWRNFEPARRELAEAALRNLHETATLSRNTGDILERTLAG
ncbi:MAG: DUF3458 domain-containing protein [Hyphomicrobiales bacterium]|nr:MAG: DUF3458 domain-containing protein [Hyphomicrobiales bacterium]